MSLPDRLARASDSLIGFATTAVLAALLATTAMAQERALVIEAEGCRVPLTARGARACWHPGSYVLILTAGTTNESLVRWTITAPQNGARFRVVLR